MRPWRLTAGQRDILRSLAMFTLGCLLIVQSTARPIIQAAERSATIAGFAFQPQPLIVVAGDNVTWINSDAAIHTVTEVGGAWDSDDLAQGQIFTQVFPLSGRYDYFCAIHPAMQGTVIVVDPRLYLPFVPATPPGA